MAKTMLHAAAPATAKQTVPTKAENTKSCPPPPRCLHARTLSRCSTVMAADAAATSPRSASLSALHSAKSARRASYRKPCNAGHQQLNNNTWRRGGGKRRELCGQDPKRTQLCAHVPCLVPALQSSQLPSAHRLEALPCPHRIEPSQHEGSAAINSTQRNHDSVVHHVRRARTL